MKRLASAGDGKHGNPHQGGWSLQSSNTATASISIIAPGWAKDMIPMSPSVGL
jgi:hypothetical protein